MIGRPKSYLLLAMVALSGCGKDEHGEERVPSAVENHGVKRVVLKFQDSTGWTEKALPGDSLGPNLRGFIASARAAPDSGAFPQDPYADITDSLFLGSMEICGCSSPLDSLEVEFADGRKEAYQTYCGDTRRVKSGNRMRLRIDEIDMTMLNNRWRALRSQYCPRRYGCSSGEPRIAWRTGIRWQLDSAWVMTKRAPASLGDSLERLLEKSPPPDPMVRLLISLKIRAGVVERIAVDSVGARYAALADTLAARGYSERVRLADGTHRFQLSAFNYFLEK